MKVLLDHCVRKPFGRPLIGHHAPTSRFMGRERLSNGALLSATASEHEVAITITKRPRLGQDIAELPVPALALDAMTNKPHVLEPFAPESFRLLGTMLQRRVYTVRLPGALAGV
ncbi:MAG: hypothetical protein IT438_06395 [Phycisphaerales bacterium]|nr:hypothetical protein [Phycisphaerales bacterium]